MSGNGMIMKNEEDNAELQLDKEDPYEDEIESEGRWKR
jgi:hypothetical protein